jgi:dipeptidase D
MSVLDASIPVFRYFEEISAIPRGSGNEEGVSRYLAGFAERQGLNYVRDALNNVVIYKPGSPGREQEPPLMLQAHMDMVCEQTGCCGHDFLSDPIRLIREGNILRADGTTLGADDGAGVSWMLAVLADGSLSHPPLECVFTVGEETGMDGARGLKKDLITARRMIGLDGHGETVTCVSSSGGRRLLARCPIIFSENTAPCYLLTVTGLRGGHSGNCIDQGLGNAIKLGFRMLYQLLERGVDIRVIRITGGAKMNAIPREFAVLFASAFSAPMLEKYVDNIAADLKEELIEADPGLTIGLEAADKVSSAITQEDTGALITMGYLLPDGMLARSPKLGIPFASLNLGVLVQTAENIDFDYCVRSPVRSMREDISRRIEAVSSIFGGFIQVQNDYDGWSYTETSPLRDALRRVLAAKGVALEEQATHGGLETGVFKGRYPQMDIITYGPRMSGCHTPDEQLELDSFLRSYENLTRVLEIV